MGRPRMPKEIERRFWRLIGDGHSTERAAAECLSLPVHPALTQSELEAIVGAVNEVAERG